MARGRKRHPGGKGRPTRSYTRDTEEYAKKLAVIISFCDTDADKTLDRFFPGLIGTKRESKRKLLYAWLKDRKTIEEMCAVTTTANMKNKRSKGTAAVLTRESEESIVLWINSIRSEGIPVSARILQLKAQAVATAQGVPSTLFDGSWPWRKGFLSHHDLSFRAKTRQGQQHPADMDAAAARFFTEIAQVMAELGVRKVYNADQSGICFEYLPKRTISDRSTKTVWVRCGGRDKDRMTGMFLGDSEGTKYTPFITWKTDPSKFADVEEENILQRQGFGVRLWKQVRALQDDHGVQIYGNKCAWWNASLTIQFLDYHFANRDEDVPVLLLLDGFSGHWTMEVTDYAAELNVYLLKVPPGLTGVCQPADVSWFKPLKERLRAQWATNLRARLQEHDRLGEGAPPFSLKGPTKGNVVQWISSAWGDLSPQIIRSGFNGTSQPADIAPIGQNVLIERLTTLSVIEETIREEDDVIPN